MSNLEELGFKVGKSIMGRESMFTTTIQVGGYVNFQDYVFDRCPGF